MIFKTWHSLPIQADPNWKTVLQVICQLFTIVASQVVSPGRDIEVGVGQADPSTFGIVGSPRIIITRSIDTLMQVNKVRGREKIRNYFVQEMRF